MSSKKDMRRPDLVVPFQEPKPSSSEAPDMGSTLSSTLPMAAIFTRNRYVGWASLVFAIQSWLGESEGQASSSSSPGYFTVGMSAMALGVTYLPLFMPQPPGMAPGASSADSAAPPVPV